MDQLALIDIYRAFHPKTINLVDISIFNRDFEFHAKSKTPLARKNASYNSPVRLTSRAMIQSQLREREKASFRVPWDSGVCI